MQKMRIELVILKHLMNEEDYARRTLPYLKSEYFTETTEKFIYQEIDKYLSQYNALPTNCLLYTSDAADD